MIEVKYLCVKRGNFSLKNLSLQINEGESLALLGPSGAGKTLFLETVLGLRKPDSGQVLTGDRVVHDIPPEELSVSFLPQDLALFPHLSVYENIAFCLRLKGAPESEIKEKVHELAKKLAIDKLLARTSVTSLSGGEKQRVALARALVGNPRFLFLDEPFCALDGARQRELHREVRRAQKAMGLTMFFVTHSLEEAHVMADKVALLRNGEIVQQGPPREVFDKPKSAWAAHFLLYENIFQGEIKSPGKCLIEECELTFVGADYPLGKRSFALRAKDLTLNETSEHFIKVFAGSPLTYGRQDVLTFKVSQEQESQEFLLSLRNTNMDELPKPGDQCKVYYDPKDVQVLEEVSEGATN